VNLGQRNLLVGGCVDDEVRSILLADVQGPARPPQVGQHQRSASKAILVAQDAGDLHERPLGDFDKYELTSPEPRDGAANLAAD
jgi:hypothetical protein